jgi:hypothetical protein
LTKAYLGIENEFQLMQHQGRVPFLTHFSSLLGYYQKPHFKKTSQCIRTATGTSIYSDGNEPEAVTPPIRVRKGLMTDMIDAVYLARKDIMEFIHSHRPLELIGYSTHFNISYQDHSPVRLLEQFGVPYALFILNPLSRGMAFREKPGRHELLGDYLISEAQNGAFALLYAATILGYPRKAMPFKYGTRRAGLANILSEGRDTQLPVLTNQGESKTITAQQYLEECVRVFSEEIEELASPAELRLFKRFVSGKTPLDIDRKEYATLEALKETEGFMKHTPLLTLKPERYRKDRQVPVGVPAALSRFASKNGSLMSVEGMEWSAVNVTVGKAVCNCTYDCPHNPYSWYTDSIQQLELVGNMPLPASEMEWKKLLKMVSFTESREVLQHLENVTGETFNLEAWVSRPASKVEIVKEVVTADGRQWSFTPEGRLLLDTYRRIQ